MGRGRWRRTEGRRPSRSPLYKGTRAGLGRPFQPIRLIKVTAGEAVDRPPRPIEGAWESTHARLSFTLRHACCVCGARDRRDGMRGAVVSR